jgi:hypothetical protein
LVGRFTKHLGSKRLDRTTRVLQADKRAHGTEAWLPVANPRADHAG